MTVIPKAEWPIEKPEHCLACGWVTERLNENRGGPIRWVCDPCWHTLPRDIRDKVVLHTNRMTNLVLERIEAGEAGR